MITLIVGTPDSGKSLLAEDIAQQTGNAEKYYIATMIPYGEEGQKRVEKHRMMREGKGFITLEWPDSIREHIEEGIEFSDATVLLECMSNLVGNEMYNEANKADCDTDLVERITDSIAILADQAKSLVVVTNVFPLQDDGYDEDTRRYVKIVETVNNKLISMADVIFTCENGEWQRHEGN